MLYKYAKLRFYYSVIDVLLDDIFFENDNSGQLMLYVCFSGYVPLKVKFIKTLVVICYAPSNV